MIIAVGRKYMIGSIWMIIVRDLKSRIGGLKVLNDIIEKMKLLPD